MTFWSISSFFHGLKLVKWDWADIRIFFVPCYWILCHPWLTQDSIRGLYHLVSQPLGAEGLFILCKDIPQRRSSAPLGQSRCPLQCNTWGRHSLMLPHGKCPSGQAASPLGLLLASSTGGQGQTGGETARINITRCKRLNKASHFCPERTKYELHLHWKKKILMKLFDCYWGYFSLLNILQKILSGVVMFKTFKYQPDGCGKLCFRSKQFCAVI